MKKLLLLGGSRYLVPVIREAKALGCHTITCDYLPDNYAHKISDEYHNVSIVDKEATLKLAQAYVAEQMGLPNVGPYESVAILQDKGRFRAFLREHGFRVPTCRSFTALEDALREAEHFSYPLIVKPVDNAGSKGVGRVDSPAELEAAIRYALKFTRCGRFILEDFIQQQGFSSDTDCFSVDGELKFVSFDNQYFDRKANNPYAPVGYTWPSTIPAAQQKELRSELQSPRGGGNRLSEMLEYTSGTRLVHNAVRAALGLPVEEMHDPVYQGHWSIVMLHAERSGAFRKLWIAEDARASLVEEDLWVNPGDPVEAFAGANNAVGSLVLNWPTEAERDARMADVSSWARILTEGEQDA